MSAAAAAAAAAAANFPNWVMLERFVFRRDDEESFPDENEAPIRASGTTSWDFPFRIAFKLADPPAISRLYAYLPCFPPPEKQTPLGILATHNHLALFRVGFKEIGQGLLQDFFIYNASDAGNNPSSSSSSSSSTLVRLPACTLPDLDDHTGGRQFRRRRRPPPVVECRRLLTIKSIGFLSLGERESVVAELNLIYSGCLSNVVDAGIFYLRSSALPASAIVDGEWKSARVPVRKSKNKSRLTWQELRSWQTDTIIPAHDCLCWIDYERGILTCDFKSTPPTVIFTAFPSMDEFFSQVELLSPPQDPRIASCWFYCGVSATDAADGRVLKLVRVIRHDDKRYGPLETDAGFTITCNTLVLVKGTMVWRKDYSKPYTVTSKELWSANPPERLPRDILMCPQVDIDRPDVVHFLVFDEFKYLMKKMSVVTIDLSTRIAESCFRYINGREDIGTEDAELTKAKSNCPRSFLASEFSKYLHISR